MLTNKNRISVIVPCYNRARTIRRCIDSILSQSFPPYEIIVVDDCSTDETVKIVQNYKDKRVRCVLLDKKAGAQSARNQGIIEAQGEWVAFQDSDDEWSPEKLQKQIRSLAEFDFNPMTVVHTNCFRLDYRFCEKTVWELPSTHGETVFPLLLKRPGPLFPGMLTSKIALETIGLLDENVPSYQEWDTSIRLARNCRFIHLKEPLFTYHLHSGDTISKCIKRDIDGYQYIVNKFRGEIQNHCGNEVLSAHLVFNALKALRYGYYENAESILGKCIGKSAKVYILKKCAKYRIYPYLLIFLNDFIHRAKLTLAKKV